MNDCQEYRVGRFTLQPFRQLLDGGAPVPIGRKALDLLSVLAKAEGALVTKDELMAAVWPKAIVEDNAHPGSCSGVAQGAGHGCRVIEHRPWARLPAGGGARDVTDWPNIRNIPRSGP